MALKNPGAHPNCLRLRRPRSRQGKLGASAGRQITFEQFGASPGNSYTWVELRDDLTVSLLQARLIELNLPINVAVGTRD